MTNSIETLARLTPQEWSEYQRARYSNLFQFEYHGNHYTYTDPTTHTPYSFSLIDSNYNHTNFNFSAQVTTAIDINNQNTDRVERFNSVVANNDLAKNEALIRIAAATSVDNFIKKVEESKQKLEAINELERLNAENEKFQKEWWHLSSTKRQHKIELLQKAYEFKQKYNARATPQLLRSLTPIPTHHNDTNLSSKQKAERFFAANPDFDGSLIDIQNLNEIKEHTLINSGFSSLPRHMRNLNLLVSHFPIEQREQLQKVVNELNQASSITHSLTTDELRKDLGIDVQVSRQDDTLLKTSLMGQSNLAVPSEQEINGLRVNAYAFPVVVDSVRTKISRVKKTYNANQTTRPTPIDNIPFSAPFIQEQPIEQPKTLLGRFKTAIVSFFTGNN